MASRKDWLLMALAHRRGAPMTPVQIQKSMFLMAMEAGSHLGTQFYRFVPYNYGPFDIAIYRDLNELAAAGLVVANTEPGRNWKAYSITLTGMTSALHARPDVDQRAVDYLHRVVDWVTSLSFTTLVRAIYEKYPQFKKNSIFVG